MRPCHPERNEVKSKFARRVIDERENRKAKPLRDLSKSVALQWRKVTFCKKGVGVFIPRPRFICAGEIPRLAFVRSLGMTQGAVPFLKRFSVLACCEHVDTPLCVGRGRVKGKTFSKVFPTRVPVRAPTRIPPYFSTANAQKEKGGMSVSVTVLPDTAALTFTVSATFS